jgi:hypothetical protein
MVDTATIGFPEAASRFGVPIWVLRRAIRAGKIPAPADASAVAPLSEAWIASVLVALQETPTALSWHLKQRVPPFARYQGTSAWRKYASRVRDYNRFRAAASKAV